MAAVTLDGVAKRFDQTPVVFDLSLLVPEGSVVALLGPSGSGKTTTLRLIAGFETPDRGRILLGDRDVTHLLPVKRRAGMVFQHYALFPHMSVFENVAYGLSDQRLSTDARRRRVSESLALVDLAGYEARAVVALSGGQQQRVALARALAPEPAVLLLDEPLSNLDPTLREKTRRELRELMGRIGLTTVLVTHEQEEAFELADQVAVLLSGTLAQVGTPEQLYREPVSRAVASFVGRVGTLPGRVVEQCPDGVVVEAAGVRFAATGAGLDAGQPVDLLLRPEALRLASDGMLTATVLRRRFVGAHDALVVRLGTAELELPARPLAARPGDSVRLAPTGTGAHAFGEEG